MQSETMMFEKKVTHLTKLWVSVTYQNRVELSHTASAFVEERPNAHSDIIVVRLLETLPRGKAHKGFLQKGGIDI